jgi:FkbM family methyltransferase
MSLFVSYAQNFEDLTLWRALRHIERGFYVDVGANHPTDDSVTKAFYDRGWRGVNIEPLPLHHRELVAERPRDVNLACAAGEEDGFADLYDFGGRGLASMSPDVVGAHSAGDVAQIIRAPVRRLSAILDQYAPADIHFLKIDVEGMEASVLRGLDLRRHRPWIIVVEATQPNSTRQRPDAQEILERQEYILAWFDGLNQFFVAREKRDLSAPLQTPVNVLDHYLHIDKLRLRARMLDAHRRLHAIESANAGTETIGGRQALATYLAGLRVAALHRLRHSPVGPFLVALRRDAPRMLRALRRGSFSIEPREPTNASTGAALMKPVRLAKDIRPLVWHDRSSASERSTSIRLMGHVEGPYSLAIVNRGLALALARLAGVQVDLVPCHHAPYSDPRDLPAEDAAALRALINADAARPVDLSISHHYPILPDQGAAAVKCAFFFWEETLVPEEMIETLEREFDAIFVASRFVRNALINSGCERPIFLTPVGLSFTARDERKRNRGSPFRFLHVSSGFPRKGVDVLLRAYAEAFCERDDVELYIKTFPNPHQNVRREIETLRKRVGALPPIIVDETPCDAEGMRALYVSADCVVLPTRGEGFNLPAAEALATGAPLIVTAHGGHAEFAQAAGAHVLNFKFAPARTHLSAPGACWVEPDGAALARAMWRIARPTVLQDALEAARAPVAAETVRAQLTFDHGARSILANAEFLRSRVKDAGGRLRIAFVSSGGPRCGVADHSRRLLEEVRRSGDFDVVTFLDDRTAAGSSDAGTSGAWRIGDNSILRCLASIKEANFDLVWVHHQPALFDLEAAAPLLAEIAQAGACVALELHSSAEVVVGRRLSPKAVGALRDIERIVVHQVADMNHLRALGLSNNLLLTPLGVEPLGDQTPEPEPRARLGVGDHELLVGTFGFLFPHKGVDVVLRALIGVEAALGRRVRYLCLNALASEEARPLLESYKALAEELGVSDRVIWRNQFQAAEDALSALAACDLILFPYGRGRESASAALTFAMRAGRPLVVSDEAIFDDAADIAFQMNGPGAAQLVEAIVQAVNDPQGCARRNAEMRAWAERRSFPKIGRALARTFRALTINRAIDSARLGDGVARGAASRTMFVDVSELYFRDAKTGIQRVVRNILREMQADPPHGFVIRPVYALPGSPWRHTRKFDLEPETGAPVEDAMALGGSGDVFLGLDLSAHLFPANERFIEDLRDAGVVFHFVVYDIIPLVYPQYADPGLVRAFHAWIDGLWRLADGLSCISESVAQDVRGFFASHYPEQVGPYVTSFHLGADFKAETPAAPEALEISCLPPCAKFLMVGTVEPRKGHAFALDAFELLWESGVDVCLVVIGKAGWMVEPLVARLRAHKELGRRLFWFETASDGELASFYNACDCLIAASEAEGFGLPLIEAAHHGLPILARDIRVFREVAGEWASYFSGRDPEELFNAVCIWLERRAEGRVVSSSGITWLTWRESCARLLGHVLDA